MKTEYRAISKSYQGVYYEESLTLGKRKLRIRIRSDHYKIQSHASIELFGPDLKWDELHSIPYGRMATKEGLVNNLAFARSDGPFDAQQHGRHFEDDRAELISHAEFLLP